MKDKKLYLSVADEDVARLDVLREELGMNRSQYIRYLISGEKKRIPESIRLKELINQLANIDLHLRRICLKDGVETKDILYINEALKDIKNLFLGASGPLDQRWTGGDENEKTKD